MKKPIACLLLLLLVSFAMADMMPDFKLPDATGKNVTLQELL